MKMVLDETVLNNRPFVNYLLKKQEKTYLPALSYLEYTRQHIKKGKTSSMVDAFLNELKIEVIPLNHEEVRMAASMDVNDYLTATISAAALIMKAVLVTENPDTYPRVDQVRTPEMVLKEK
ncbi:MAG: hypothetical protein Q8N08_01925 [Methanobacteriaceae archaeon]|nr:hypothetical protein [Methanobacteriaceae archaeon]